MTTEEMRQAWAETSRRLERLEQDCNAQRREAMDGRRKTALDDLARRYRRFAIAAMIFIVAFPLAMHGHPSPISPLYTTWVIVFGVLYFGTASAMDWWLYRQVTEIDVSHMTVEEVAERSAFCRKRHLQFVCVLLPMALGFVAFFLYCTLDSPYVIAGGIAGFIVGALLGLRQLRRFLSDYRYLRG